MAKRIDPLKAKQAKQKKLAIVLGVVLVAVGAFQGPKTLKMLKGPQPVETAAPAPAPTPPATPAPDGTATPSPTTAPLPAGTPDAQPAVLVDSDLPPAASTSQLLSFERFVTKDPFEQQVKVTASGDDDAAPVDEGAAAPADSSTEDPSDASGAGSAPQDDDAGAEPPSFTSEPSEETEAPAPPAPAAETTIAVNGVVATVETKATFPEDDPVFQLVSLGRNGKSVRIGIAGGSYADGQPTIELVLGKKLTLQNTADGSRYELKLLTVEGFAPPKKP
jgi:hypothetical protein